MQNVSGLLFGSNVGDDVEMALVEARERVVALAAAERISSWIASFRDFMSLAGECSSEEEIEFRLELACRRFPESGDVKAYSAKCRNLLEEKLWRNVENAYVSSFVRERLPAYIGVRPGFDWPCCEWRSLEPVLSFVSHKAPFVAGEIASRLATRLSKIRTGLTTVYHGNVPPAVADLQETETRLLNFTVWRS